MISTWRKEGVEVASELAKTPYTSLLEAMHRNFPCHKPSTLFYNSIVEQISKRVQEFDLSDIQA